MCEHKKLKCPDDEGYCKLRDRDCEGEENCAEPSWPADELETMEREMKGEQV